MSTTVDKRVVEMQFRNEKFEAAADQTIKTLDRIEKHLHFNDNSVGKSVDKVASKLHGLSFVWDKMAIQMVNDAYKIGKSFVKSLTTDNIGQGFGEYELKMGSIQTIMAGTGESLETVNKYLDELNLYADKTIYSFSDMTSNIGKFTNAGVKLEDAVAAIQGVANLAAISGANAEQASHSMYNFAQSLSAGYVQLVDWKSIETANMATVEFKNILIETAEEIGTLVKVGDQWQSTTTDLTGNTSDLFDAIKNFNGSLSSQWMTADVLTRALAKYTDEQTELGKKAFTAATEIKTFTQMMDTLKESVGSGWATSFEIIFGDYNEAIELWTGIADKVSVWIESVSKWRNKVLDAWVRYGGKDALQESLTNLIDAINKLTKPIKDAFNLVFRNTPRLKYISQYVDPIYESLVKVSEKIRDFTAALKPSEAVMRTIERLFIGIFSAVKILWKALQPVIAVVKGLVHALSPLLKIVGALGEVISYVLQKIGDDKDLDKGIKKSVTSINDFFDKAYEYINAFADKAVAKIRELPSKFRKLLAKLKNTKIPSGFTEFWTKLTERFTAAKDKFVETGSITDFFSVLIPADSIQASLAFVWAKIQEAFRWLFNKVKETVLKLPETINDIKKMDSGGVSAFVDSIFDKFEPLKALGNTIATPLKKVFETAFNVGATLFKFLEPLFNTLYEIVKNGLDFFKKMDLSTALDISNIALFGIAIHEIKTIFDGTKDTLEIVTGVLKKTKTAIGNFAVALKDMSEAMAFSIKMEGFKSLAESIALIIIAVIALGTLPVDRTKDVTSAFLIICLGLWLVLSAIDELSVKAEADKDEPKKVTEILSQAANNISTSIKNLAKTIGKMGMILAVAASFVTIITAIAAIVAVMGNLKSDKMKQGFSAVWQIVGMMATMLSIIGIMFAGLAYLNKNGYIDENFGKILVGMSGSLVLLAIGLSAMLIPMALISKMAAGDFWKGIGGMVAMLAVISVFMTVAAVLIDGIPNFVDGIAKLSGSLALFALALVLLTAPIAILGHMSEGTLTQGLGAFVKILLTLSVAMVLVAGAIRKLGSFADNLEKVAKGFGILTLIMLGLTVALALLGPIIIANKDTIYEALMILVDAACQTIIEGGASIIDAALVTVMEVLGAVIAYLPAIETQVEVILVELLSWLIEFMPELVDKLMEAIGILFKGVADGVSKYMNSKDIWAVLLTVEVFALIVTQMIHIGENIKKAVPVAILMATLMALVIGSFVVLNKWGGEPDAILKMAGAIAIVLAAMALIIFTLAKTAEDMQKLDMAATGLALGTFVLALGAVALALGLMTAMKVDPGSAVAYSEALAIAVSSMALVIIALGLALKLAPRIDPASATTLVLTFAAVIGIVLLIATAIGALDAAFNGDIIYALEQGVEAFRLIGECLGALIGGLIGGGVQTALEDIGEGLGEFTNKSQPFFDLVTNLKEDFGTKIGYLTTGIFALASAGFIEAISNLFSIFTGESSLEKLGEDLAAMAPHLKEFYDSMGDIDIDKAEGIKAVAEAVAVLFKAIPNEGGFLSLIMGTTDTDSFIGFLPSLGDAMIEFQTNTKGLNKTTIEYARDCGLIISGLVNALPKKGGVAQWWNGNVDYFTFASGLPKVGEALVQFQKAVTDESQGGPLQQETIELAANCGKILTGLADTLPSTGGILQQWMGEKDMGKFASNLVPLGEAIKGFNDAVTDSNGNSNINEQSVQTAVWVAESVVGLQQSLPKSGGFFEWANGFPDLSTFSNNLPTLGTAIMSFATRVKNISTTGVPTAITAAEAIAGLQVTLGDSAIETGPFGWFTTFPDLGDFAEHLPQLGEGIKGLSDSMEGANLTRVQTATKAIVALVDVVKLTDHLEEFSLNAFNDAIAALDFNALEMKTTDFETNENLQQAAQTFYEIGQGYIKSLYNGMSYSDENTKNLLKVRAASIIGLIGTYFTVVPDDPTNDFWKAGENMIAGMVNGLEDLYQNTRLEIAARTLVKKVVNHIEDEAGIASPSKRTEQDGKYMVQGLARGFTRNLSIISSAGDIVGEEACTSLAKSLNAAYDIINGDVDLTPTIAPVVDMTNVQNAAGEMQHLFSANDYSVSPDLSYANRSFGNLKMKEVVEYQPTDLSKVTEQLELLNQKMANLESQIGPAQVVLDTGTLVGEMTNPMITSINRVNKMADRGLTNRRLINSRRS